MASQAGGPPVASVRVASVLRRAPAEASPAGSLELAQQAEENARQACPSVPVPAWFLP